MLLVLQFVLAAVLVVIVLLQKSSSIGLGAYSGSNETVFGAKGAAGFLTKLTFTLALLFIANTLALGYFYNSAKKTSITEEMKEQKVIPAVPKTVKDDSAKAPVAPTAPSEKK
jgi:preprotein translocase subunit SecG